MKCMDCKTCVCSLAKDKEAKHIVWYKQRSSSADWIQADFSWALQICLCWGFSQRSSHFSLSFCIPVRHSNPKRNHLQKRAGLLSIVSVCTCLILSEWKIHFSTRVPSGQTDERMSTPSLHHRGLAFDELWLTGLDEEPGTILSVHNENFPLDFNWSWVRPQNVWKNRLALFQKLSPFLHNSKASIDFSDQPSTRMHKDLR